MGVRVEGMTLALSSVLCQLLWKALLKTRTTWRKNLTRRVHKQDPSLLNGQVLRVSESRTSIWNWRTSKVCVLGVRGRAGWTRRHRCTLLHPRLVCKTSNRYRLWGGAWRREGGEKRCISGNNRPDQELGRLWSVFLLSSESVMTRWPLLCHLLRVSALNTSFSFSGSFSSKYLATTAGA